jgi:hypothetical protein
MMQLEGRQAMQVAMLMSADTTCMQSVHLARPLGTIQIRLLQLVQMP